MDLERDLSAASGPGRHPLPDPAAFADRMGALGFGDDHAIVVYDTANGMVAARLWWMLDRLGHREVAVLDGGLAAWTAAGGELTPFLPTHLRTSLSPVAQLVEHDRPRGHPARTRRPSTWSTSGRRSATGARSSPSTACRATSRALATGRWPPCWTSRADSSRRPPAGRCCARMAREPRRPQVMSCGSGVTACLGILASRVAGLPDPLLYPGSYSDWSAAHLPVATAEET